MSLNDPSNEGIIGGSISKEVANQIAARKKIFANPNGVNNNYINYTSGNTGWVRISSSVDTLTVDKKPSSELAKQNVLLGGTLTNEVRRQGIFSTNSSYDDTVLGKRPMAGITGFTVENRSFAGALRIGSFELTLTSLEQLTALEQLYMRPGFTLFIEYGHSVYVDNKGEIQTNTPYLKNYFDLTDREEIVKSATKIRDEVTDYNYDFMYAYVTNFTWQSSEIGIYDVSVTFVTSGDLIDSVSAALTAGDKIKSDNSVSKSLKDRTTALHAIMYYINNADTEKFFDKETLEQDDSKDVRTAKIEEALVKNCSPVWPDIKQELEENNRFFHVIRTQIGNTSTDGSWFRYISLATLLQCVNRLFIPVTVNGKPIFKFNISRYSPFTTFKEHFCIDPSIAVIPKEYLSTADTNFRIRFAEQENDGEDTNDLLNVYINIGFITGLLDSLLSSDEFTQQSVYVFIHSILKRLSSEFGGINDFDLHLEDDTDEWYIVDRSVLPNAQKLKDDRYKLDIFGIGSTVENFNLGSTIPSSMSAMVAASAGAESSDIRNKLHSMFRWNAGLVDRTVKTLVYSSTVNNQLESIRDEMITLARYLKNVNVSPYYINYLEEEVQASRQLHKKLMSIFLEYYTNSPERPEDRVNASGLIPIKLSISMKGLSGLKIGQAFTVQDGLLPGNYRTKAGKPRVAFMINRLSNTIAENKWMTELDAMMFSLDVPEDISNEVNTLAKIAVADLEKEFENLSPPQEVDIPEIEFVKPLLTLNERNDSQGSGFWLAPRKDNDGTSRLHLGWDLEAKPGSFIYAAIDGQVYKNAGFSRGFPSIGILGTGDYNGFIFTYGYCDWREKFVPPWVNQPKELIQLVEVKKGDLIGQVLDLTKPYAGSTTAYPADIINHIHLKVDYNGTLIDPSKLVYK